MSENDKKNNSNSGCGCGYLVIIAIIVIIGLFSDFDSSNNTTSSKSIANANDINNALFDGTPPGDQERQETADKIITSQDYIKNKAAPLFEEARKMKSRRQAGLEADENAIKLIEFKIDRLDSLQGSGSYEGFTPVDVDIKALEENCRNNPEVDFFECVNKKNIKTAVGLRWEHIKLKETLDRKDISQEEFKTLENKILQSNKRVIIEADKIINLKKIPYYYADEYMPTIN